MLPLSAVSMAAVAVFKYSPISPILSPLPPAHASVIPYNYSGCVTHLLHHTPYAVVDWVEVIRVCWLQDRCSEVWRFRQLL